MAEAPVAVAVSAKPFDKPPDVYNRHPRECMCRECRIAHPGVYCPYWDDAGPSDGPEPLRAHSCQVERRWRSAAELEEERRRWAEERRARQDKVRAEEAERQRVEAEAAVAAERRLEHRRSEWPPPVLDPAPAAGYDEVHRYDGVLLTWGTRAPLRKPVVPTQRDIDILQALWRHRILSSSQIKAIWWPTAQLRKAQERLKELFDLGVVDKFRPPSLRGSYQLSQAGFDGDLETRTRIPRCSGSAYARPRRTVGCEPICRTRRSARGSGACARRTTSSEEPTRSSSRPRCFSPRSSTRTERGERVHRQARADFRVEPICRTLGVSASAYYERRSGNKSERAIEDERLTALIKNVHEQNYFAYGYRRMWIALKRAGEDVARCRVQRLMRAAGIQCAKRRGKPWRTTKPNPLAKRRPGLVERNLSTSGRARSSAGSWHRTCARPWSLTR